jgi:uncharacterized membrane protein
LKRAELSGKLMGFHHPDEVICPVKSTPMRTLFFIAIVANSLDLVATAFGIHWFGNREGNPLMADLAHHHWLYFVVLKGLGIPFLIWRLNDYRRTSPLLASAGLCVVTLAMTLAVGQWLGWLAGVMRVSGLPRL